MKHPTTTHINKYRTKVSDSDQDDRLSTDVFERNKIPILKALTPYLDKHIKMALEIGSGTGQHLSYLAQNFPHVTWQGSDFDKLHCKSINAWSKYYSLNIPPALNLNAAADWESALKNKKNFDLIISMNVIHIAPIEVLNGIFCNASKCLKDEGILVFYGPFKQNNMHVGDGNKIFDQRLRAENPNWGVRCINLLERLGTENNINLFKTIKMPANNFLIIFKKNPQN